MTDWAASMLQSVRLAPNWSATRPVATRPKIDENPDTPSIVAAAMAGTPRSMACETMWKIGPECAAQHAKWVMPMAQTGQAVKIERSVFAMPATDRALSEPGALRRRSAEGITMSQARSPRIKSAVRQSNWLMSHRESGDN